MKKEVEIVVEKALKGEKGWQQTRSFKVTPMAPMGGGTQLYEGAHLNGAIRAFVANQANVAIMGFLLL